MTERPDPKLIRLYCDGELTPERVAQFERELEANPQERQAIDEQRALEGKLRSCIGKCMCDCGPAPDTLRDSIKQAWKRDAEIASQPAIAGRIGASAGIFSGPQRANIFAVAATLALVLGAVLFGIFGRTIDDVRPIRSADDAVGQAALFASVEHDERTLGTRKVDLDAQARDIRSAELELSNHLGVAVKVFDLNEVGYEFIGAWKSGLPLSDRSAHIMYRSTRPDALKPMVSLYVAPYSRCKGVCRSMESGKWECAGSARECRHNVLYSTDKTLIYFLVCCDEKDLERLTTHITQIPAQSGR